MKYFKIITILLLIFAISFYACNDKSKAKKKETVKPMKIIDLPKPTSTGSVWHYTCSKGCPGGAGSAVNCTTCGTLLVHNQAYHSNTNSTPTSNATSNNAPFNTTPSTSSGRNAAGVWHYTCNNGCAGGSGSAGNCSTCGNALAHNAAYH